MDAMTKGKIAEKLVEDMFKEAGFTVLRAGYEHSFNILADRYNLIKGPAAKYIRHHPDLIVVDRSNHAYLIEVKYRRFGTIYQKDLFNYPETQVVLLTKDSIHCQHLKEIHKNGKKFVPLSSMKPFSDIPASIVQKYLLKTRRALGDENIFGQLIEKISQKLVGKSFVQTYTPAGIKFSYIEDTTGNGSTYEYAAGKEVIRRNDGKVTAFRDGKSWNQQEIRRLKTNFSSKIAISKIASSLGRKRDAVIFRLVRLGLISINEAGPLIKGGEFPKITKVRKVVKSRINKRKRSSRSRTNKRKSTAGKIRIHKIIRRRKK